jgi:hypothetical protein
MTYTIAIFEKQSNQSLKMLASSEISETSESKYERVVDMLLKRIGGKTGRVNRSEFTFDTLNRS